MEVSAENAEVVSMVKSDANLKNYYCPHCGRLVMKGNVNQLTMNCPHCLILINATGDELLERPRQEEEA